MPNHWKLIPEEPLLKKQINNTMEEIEKVIESYPWTPRPGGFIGPIDSTLRQTGKS